MDCFLHVLQTETKPVQMMNLEATFCLGYVKDLNVAILELPCLNKHISMLILLPKEIEDESTGLEKVREKIQNCYDTSLGNSSYNAVCSWKVFVI